MKFSGSIAVPFASALSVVKWLCGLNLPITDEQLEHIQQHFSDLLTEGRFELRTRIWKRNSMNRP